MNFAIPADLLEVIGRNDFAARHIGISPADVSQMLEAIGAASVERLIHETVPDAIRQRAPLELGRPLSESEALEKIRHVAALNKKLVSLIGQGYYGTILPPSSSEISWKTLPGTRPTRPIKPRSARAGWKLCSIFRQ